MKENIRQRIIDILIEPSTVTELKNKLKDVESFGTIAYHLKKLEHDGILKKQRDSSKRGCPTTYSLIDEGLIEVVKDMKERSRISKVAILKKIREYPMIEDAILSLFVERADLPHGALDDIFGCSNDKLATLHFKITEKGEKFLKQNGR